MSDEAQGRPVGLILATVALTTMLAPLNSTMIGVALPSITAEFSIDLDASAWLVIAYLIVMASLQPVAGKLGGRWGHRRMILGGLVYFAVVSVGAALATDFSSLLFFRVQQAVAGAVALPNGTAVMRRVVGAGERGRRFGLVGAAVVLAAAAGPPLGGVLIEWAGWRAVFYVNLALILPTLFLGWRVLPVFERHRDEPAFDWVGALALLALLAGGAFFLTRQEGLQPSLLAAGAGVFVLACGAFLRREWRHPDPVFQPRFFLSRTFAAANAAISLSNLAMYTTFLALPLLLASTPGWGSARAGALLAVMWGPTAACAPLGGRLVDRWGRRWPTATGLFFFALGLWVISLTGARAETGSLVVGLALAGIGLGLSQAGMQTAAVEAVPAREAGVAAGIFSTSRYIGSITGSSLLPLLYTGAGGFDRVLFLVLAAAVAAVAASLAIEDRPRGD